MCHSLSLETNKNIYRYVQMMYAIEEGLISAVAKTAKIIPIKGRFAVDTSDHRTVNALRWKTAILEAQMDTLMDGMLIVDENQKRISINKQLIDLWNVPEHILKDDNDTPLLDYVTSEVKYPEQFIEKVTYLYDNLTETSRDEIEFKNGKVLDRYSAPVMGEDGHYYGRIWTFREINTLQGKFRNALKSLPIAVQGYRSDGTTRYWDSTSESLYGYTAQEAIGKNLVDLIIPPEMRTEVEESIKVMTSTGQAVPSSEVSLMRKDGSRVTVFSSHVVINAPHGKPELFCLDIAIGESSL